MSLASSKTGNKEDYDISHDIQMKWEMNSIYLPLPHGVSDGSLETSYKFYHFRYIYYQIISPVIYIQLSTLFTGASGFVN